MIFSDISSDFFDRCSLCPYYLNRIIFIGAGQSQNQQPLFGGGGPCRLQTKRHSNLQLYPRAINIQQSLQRQKASPCICGRLNSEECQGEIHINHRARCQELVTVRLSIIVRGPTNQAEESMESLEGYCRLFRF